MSGYDEERGAKRVRKVNKRLYLVNGDGSLGYTPPDFVQVRHRGDMVHLAEEIDRIGYLPAIIAFERAYTKRWHP